MYEKKFRVSLKFVPPKYFFKFPSLKFQHTLPFEKFIKFCGFMSILRNSIWIAFLMILWSLLNPQYTYAMFYRIGLKLIEFYILWSTYASVKIFEGLRKVSKLCLRMKATFLAHFSQNKALQASFWLADSRFRHYKHLETFEFLHLVAVMPQICMMKLLFSYPLPKFD